MMARVGKYWSQGIVARYDFPFATNEGILFRRFFMESHRSFFAREGGNIKRALSRRGEEFATNFVCNDAHI